MVSWIPKHRCICRQCVLSASMRLCEESVICKVASIDSLNSKQVSFWIFTSGRLNFVLFYIWLKSCNPFPRNDFSCVFLMIDSYFKWFCLFIYFGRIKRLQFVWFLVSKQCKQLFLFCDSLVSSINALRIVCLSRTAFWLSVLWVRGIQEFRFAYKFNHPLKIHNIN